MKSLFEILPHFKNMKEKYAYILHIEKPEGLSNRYIAFLNFYPNDLKQAMQVLIIFPLDDWWLILFSLMRVENLMNALRNVFVPFNDERVKLKRLNKDVKPFKVDELFFSILIRGAVCDIFADNVKYLLVL